MQIDKSEIVAALRSRELHARADWVVRELPDSVDTDKNDALLQMLGVDPATMQSAGSPADAAPRPAGAPPA
jgi:hypothetical protein